MTEKNNNKIYTTHDQKKLIFKKRTGTWKTLWKARQELANFNEPVVMLERRSGDVEFYEGIKANEFKFEHSSGKTNKIYLGTKQKRFKYGDTVFKGYTCHEDIPFPTPQTPLITTEELDGVISKTLNDRLSHAAQEVKAKGEMWQKIALGVAAIIAVLFLGNMMAPDLFKDIGLGGSSSVNIVAEAEELGYKLVKMDNYTTNQTVQGDVTVIKETRPVNVQVQP